MVGLVFLLKITKTKHQCFASEEHVLSGWCRLLRVVVLFQQELHWTSFLKALTCCSTLFILTGWKLVDGCYFSSASFTGETHKRALTLQFISGESNSSRNFLHCKVLNTVRQTSYLHLVGGNVKAIKNLLIFSRSLSSFQFLPFSSSVLWHDGSSCPWAGQCHGRPEVDRLLGLLVILVWLRCHRHGAFWAEGISKHQFESKHFIYLSVRKNVNSVSLESRL